MTKASFRQNFRAHVRASIATVKLGQLGHMFRENSILCFHREQIMSPRFFQ